MTYPLADMFQDIWKQVREERAQKIEAGVEMMVTDSLSRGLMITENQFGNVLDVQLTSSVPFGTVLFVRKDLNFDDFDSVSPPARGGGET